jgi:hypothetical protein
MNLESIRAKKQTHVIKVGPALAILCILQNPIFQYEEMKLIASHQFLKSRKLISFRPN